MAVCFFPLPGGTGATELSFNALLGSLFTEGTLFWGILIWRFLTYYLYIIQGAIILIADMFTRKKKGLKPISYDNINENCDTEMDNNAVITKDIKDDKTANNSNSADNLE